MAGNHRLLDVLRRSRTEPAVGTGVKIEDDWKLTPDVRFNVLHLSLNEAWVFEVGAGGFVPVRK
ncbi:MAG: hypothetical protein QOJ40_1805 [Verrucomicrobiota bacterium]